MTTTAIRTKEDSASPSPRPLRNRHPEPRHPSGPVGDGKDVHKSHPLFLSRRQSLDLELDMLPV